MATIQDFLNSLQHPQAAKQRSKANSSVVDSLRNTAGDLGNALAAPVQDTVAYTKLQFDPQGKAQLNAVQNSTLPDSEKERQARALLQRYGGQSQAQGDSATQGSEAFMGGMTPAAPVALAPNVAQAGVRTALPEIKNAGQKIVQDLDETMQAATAQPGGLQAGFAKLPGKGDLPALPGKAGKSPVRITLKPSVYGAGREQAAQETVDSLVPGKSGAEKYSNLQGTMDDLGSKIEGIMAKNPKTASIEQIMKDYDTNLNRDGIYRTSNEPKDVVQKAARDYVTKLYASAKGVPDNIAPSEVQDVDLYRLKQMVNADAQSIFRKIENGTTVTPREKVILAARQTLDDTLSSLHREVKDFTTKQSHLYDAADSLYKAREQEIANPPKPFSLTEAVTGKGSDFLPPILKTGIDAGARAIGNGLKSGNPAIVAPLAAGAGAVGVEAYQSDLNPINRPANNGQNAQNGEYGNQGNNVPGDNSQSNPNHVYSISDYTKDVKSPTYIPDTTEIVGADKTPLTLDTATYNQQNHALLDQKSALSYPAQLGIPSAQAQLAVVDNKLKVLGDKYATTQKLVEAHTATTNKVEGLLAAKALMDQANPTWLRVLGGKANPLTALSLTFDQSYASWDTSMKNLQAQYGIDLSGAMRAGSADVASGVIDTLAKREVNQYRQVLKDAGATGIKASGSPVAVPQGATKATKAVPSPGTTAPTVNTPQVPQQPVDQAAMAQFAE